MALAEDAAKEPFDFQPPDYSDLYSAVKAAGETQMREAYAILDKQARQNAGGRRQGRDQGRPSPRSNSRIRTSAPALKKLESTVLSLRRGQERPPDRRARAGCRAVHRVGNLGSAAHPMAPRCSHGARTQALVVTTLGTGDDEQFIDALHGNFRSNFLLHYNFPPYSVGEAGRVGPPGRREIGHGKLAWRALQAVLPAPTDFPYTIRVVSEITESNGSSSMASVCGGSLSMMDAGVPLKAPVAGVAMGLVLEEDGSYGILTDILGDEDHLGDMDFKVAGTENGITSLQMDIKVAGITPEIMEKALEQAKAGRLHILGEDGQGPDPRRASSRSTHRASRLCRSRPTRSAK